VTGRALITLAVVLHAGLAVAQDTPRSITSEELDVSVPSSPAFAMLGLTPDTVLRPASPRALAATVLNGVDPSGTLQSGVAIDVAPYFAAQGRHVTLEMFEKSAIVRFLSRLQVSAATAKAASADDDAVRLGAGLRLTFWDRGDYRGNLNFRGDLSGAQQDAVQEMTNEGLRKSPLPDVALAYDAELDRRLRLRTDVIRERYRKANWNNSAFAIGGAGTWISKTGKANGLAQSGGAVWTSLAYGFEDVPGLEDSAQFIVHARYRTGDRVPDPAADGEFVTQDSSLAGARFRVGAVDTNASFEMVYLRAEPSDRPLERFVKLTGDVEHRLFENVWLHFAVGGETGREDDEDHLFVLTTLKFAMGQRGQ
jgi:hypothetical protein